jgi:SAM-dependent methyltransferase
VDGTGLLDGYDVVACSSCGAVFSDHLPPVEHFAKYYASASKYEFSHRGGEQHREEIDRVAGLAAWLSGQIPKDCPILDVGCATGELLLKLRGEGFGDLTGLDPSHDCVQRARSLHGLSMIEGVLGSRREGQLLFGAVILSAVLEHIPDTTTFLEELKGWLAPGGLVVIEVPDLEFFKDSRHAPFQELSVEHVNFFTAASLGNLLGKSGFQPIAKRHFMCPAAPGGLTGAVVTMIGRLDHHQAEPRHEAVSKLSMEQYLAMSRAILANEEKIIEELVASQEPVIVWGTGTLCQRLLAQGKLGKVRIESFVDSNLHYQGKKLATVPIISPSEINSKSPILITSWGFQDEIIETIRTRLGLQNKLITLR